MAQLLHPTPQKRNPRGKRPPSSRRIGVIRLDMFNIEFPVFASDEDRLHELQALGYYAEPEDNAFYGLAGWSEHLETGQQLLFMVITDKATESTWAHEASHIVDMVFARLGIHTGIESTETRAYMLGHIFGCLMGIMDAYDIKKSKNLDPGQEQPQARENPCNNPKASTALARTSIRATPPSSIGSRPRRRC